MRSAKADAGREREERARMSGFGVDERGVNCRLSARRVDVALSQRDTNRKRDKRERNEEKACVCMCVCMSVLLSESQWL